MKQHLPLLALIALCAGSLIFQNASVIADTISYYIINPSASSVVNGNTGTPGKASVGTHGEQFVTMYGTPQPAPVGLQITPGAVVSVQATSVPTAFPTPQATTAAAAKFMQVCNTTNQPAVGAYAGATVPHFTIRAGDCYFRNWAANNSTYNGAVSIARPGTLPTSGEVSIWFEY